MLLEYKNALNSYKVITLYLQIGMVVARFLWLVGPSLQLVLEITQLAAVSIIYRRDQCSSQAKYFIVMSMLLLFLLLYNFIFWFFNLNPEKQKLIVQHFKNDYHLWGYSIQFLYRIFSALVIWRSYQLTLIYEAPENQNLGDRIE